MLWVSVSFFSDLWDQVSFLDHQFQTGMKILHFACVKTPPGDPPKRLSLVVMLPGRSPKAPLPSLFGGEEEN